MVKSPLSGKFNQEVLRVVTILEPFSSFYNAKNEFYKLFMWHTLLQSTK